MKLENLLQVFKALGDETRLKMIKLLYEEEMCVCKLEATFNVSQARISQNLRTLKQAGLVEDRREGKWVHYKVNKKVIAEAIAYLGEFLGEDFKFCCEMKEEYEKYEKVASKLSCE